jgi:sterol 24-C-methyltransferase
MTSIDGSLSRALPILAPEKLSRNDVNKAVESFKENWRDEEGPSQCLDARKKNYASMINNFYDLVTTFYEFGWGQSFHFAPRKTWESFETSIRRHEMYLAHQIHLFEGMTALDAGCGVGGPARCISVFAECRVVGLNNNQYQVERARKLTEQYGLSKQVSFVKGDFMNTPFEDNTFDAVYAIEATCHAPDKVGCFKELYRVAKPGAHFGCFEWTMTDKYDPTNPEHAKLKFGIEKGNALPELALTKDIKGIMEEAGWTDVVVKDLADRADAKTPWYLPLSGALTISGWKHTSWGRAITHKALGVLEFLRIAPKGSTEVSKMLCETADDLVRAGEMEIFTPLLFVRGRKPLDSSSD